MPQGIDWGPLLALCAAVVAAAHFCDEYHIKEEVRSRIRDKLIVAFIFLDKPYVPNFPQILYKKISDDYKRKGLVRRLLMGIVCYLSAITFFYLVWPTQEGYISYIFKPIASPFLLGVVVWTLCIGTASFVVMRVFLERWNRSDRFAAQFMILTLALVALAIFACVSGLGFLMLGLLRTGETTAPWPWPDFLLLGFLSAWHYVTVVLVMLFLTLVRGLLLLVHWLLRNVLDAASSPRTSPFRYFATLLAFLMLGVKFVVEVTN